MKKPDLHDYLEHRKKMFEEYLKETKKFNQKSPPKSYNKLTDNKTPKHTETRGSIYP